MDGKKEEVGEGGMEEWREEGSRDDGEMDGKIEEMKK